MEMLRARNEASHIYDEKIFLRIYNQAKDEFAFGSRAKGTAREGSDIDLVLKGKNIDPRF
jgi:predicted nucleotidyltransferase